MGYKKEDLIAGLCVALVGNYLSNVARVKKIEPIVLFQGGVAANVGIKAAFEQKLDISIVVPEYYCVMGAWGAALLARQWKERINEKTQFRGINKISSFEYVPRTFSCTDCSNNCEINELYIEGKLVSRSGSRCGKWSNLERPSEDRKEVWCFPLKSPAGID